MKKNIEKVFLGLCILAIIFSTVFFFFFWKDKSEKLIEEFFQTCFSQSDEMATLCNEYEKYSTHIGEGVDYERQKKSQKNIAKVEEDFEKIYGVYLSESGTDDFWNLLFPYIYQYYSENEDYKISTIKIQKDNMYYDFLLIVDIGEEKQQIEGRVEISEDKIIKIILI